MADSGRDSVTLTDQRRLSQTASNEKKKSMSTQISDRPANGANENSGNARARVASKDTEKDGNVKAYVEEGHTNSDEGDIQYQSLHWWQASILMIAETISLGILSLPSVFATVGMEGGILLILGLGLIATYTGLQIGKFKIAYPWIQNMADAGQVLGGKPGRYFLGTAQILFLVFVCASHTLTFLIAMHTIVDDSTCVIVWSVIGAAVQAFFCLPRTFRKLSYFSIISFISIISACLITMIGVGATGKQGMISAKGTGSFADGFLATSNVIFAYAGHLAFPTFIAEMKKPKDFPKALYMLQAFDISMYLIVGIVVYYYVGSEATSPALGNTGKTLSRVAYGVALPTILIAGVINGSVGCKLIMRTIFVRNGKTSVHYSSSTKTGWITWIAVVLSFWTLAWIIAEVIPFFNDLLGVISSLFASIFTYAISGVFWLFLHQRSTWFESPKKSMLTVFNFGNIALGLVIMGCGLYASIKGIKDGYNTGTFGSPFTCQPPS